ncbi:MAG TPA: DUF3604 domain-containing protein [Candidatus Binatia bacterium]|nr:DUF3604 domain-containing protein [Candidatus Binatia bacterium]
MVVRAVLAVLLLVAPSLGAEVAPSPWQRTETREPCANVTPLRRPFFGELHVHTAVSADAYIYGTRTEPRDAYAFARGGAIPFSDTAERPTRSAQLERPLDFAAVTDHAEYFGEVAVCTTSGSPAYDDSLCVELRTEETRQADRIVPQVDWLLPLGIPPPPLRHTLCDVPGVDCEASAVSVWHDIQAAAEESYDRTAACGFTTFIGFESTPSPLGKHLHRNVVFRNHHVPPTAAGYTRTYAGGVPQGLWTAIETECLGAGQGCDAVIIPHNPNLSGGEQWRDPADAAEALRRQTLEPLVEIHQQKGNSECRFDRLAGLGTDTADELCTFEIEPDADQFPFSPAPPIDRYPRRNLVRNTLKDGLVLEGTLGVNPFRLGLVGSTDSHDAAPGNTEEAGWEGGEGGNDASPATQIGDQLRTNPGGLAVVWAEENSRDALFAALRRRETYATSGTRPSVRLFAGDYARVGCDDAELLRAAYERGTPMGGEIGTTGRARPRFLVWATRDAGTAAHPGTDLQRIQIVKGWVAADGQARERVVDVAGGPNGADVDPATCLPRGTGASELCVAWDDPEFDPAARAFYYARVLENPTCRWSTFVCKAANVDPFAADCAARAAAADPAFADCCLGEQNDAFLAPTLQERAWTSPIWYRPDGIARVRGRIRVGRRAGGGRLDVSVRLASVPSTLDLAANPLALRLTDDDDIVALTIPAGAVPRRRGRVAVDAGVAGRGVATLVRHGQGLTLRVRTRGDLSAARGADRMVTVALASGLYRAEHTRLWTMRGGRLRTGAR